MPSYIKTSATLTIDCDLVTAPFSLNQLEEMFGTQPADPYTEAHDNYTKNFLNTFSDTSERDEDTLWEKVDELKGYVYITDVTYNTEDNDMIFTVDVYHKDDTKKTQFETWLRATNIFGNETGREAPTGSNVDFHKPYKS
jgi:hypothetical protein